MAKGGKKKEVKGKKEKVEKQGRKISALYDISSGELTRKNRNCPKCGPGMFLAKHKDRVVCGSCSYVEYNSKPVAEESESKEPELKESATEIVA